MDPLLHRLPGEFGKEPLRRETVRKKKLSGKNKKAATLVMLQLPAPAREQNNPDACTVAALDAITAFAVPNPNCPSQSRRFFQVWSFAELPRLADHPAYFGLAKF